MRYFILTSLVCLIGGCAATSIAERPSPLAGQVASEGTCKASAPAVSLARSPVDSRVESSLYDMPAVWQTDNNQPMQLSQLRGRPQVIAMFFTTCAGTCGITVNHLLQIDASLSAKDRERVGFVLVTFDSENDTPLQLSRYRAQRHLPADWNILRGSPQDTREIAMALGVRFAPDSARHILHGAQVTVVDRQGRIVRRLTGAQANMDPAISTLKLVLAGETLAADVPPSATTQPIDTDTEKSCCFCSGK